MNEKIINIAITEEQQEKVRKNSASSLPLNPTAQGWSAQKIREKLYRAICSDVGDLDDNLLDIIVDKLLSVKEVFEALQSGEFVVKKAEEDAKGNNIFDTYSTKQELASDYGSRITFGYDKSTRVLTLKLFAKDDTQLGDDLNITLPLANTTDDGLMSKNDKKNLNTLIDLLGVYGEDDDDNKVNKIREVLDVFENYPEADKLVDALANKATKEELETAGFPNGWTKELLTSSALTNGQGISKEILSEYDVINLFVIETATGEIDTDSFETSIGLVDGYKYVFFDNADVYLSIANPNCTFTATSGYQLKIIGQKYVAQDAENVNYDKTVKNLLKSDDVQGAIDEVAQKNIDNETQIDIISETVNLGNLFDNNWITGERLADGVITTGPAYRADEIYYPLYNEPTLIYIVGTATSSLVTIAFYDVSKNYISTSTLNVSSTSFIFSISVPANATYFRISTWLSFTGSLYISQEIIYSVSDLDYSYNVTRILKTDDIFDVLSNDISNLEFIKGDIRYSSTAYNNQLFYVEKSCVANNYVTKHYLTAKNNILIKALPGYKIQAILYESKYGSAKLWTGWKTNETLKIKAGSVFSLEIALATDTTAGDYSYSVADILENIKVSNFDVEESTGFFYVESKRCLMICANENISITGKDTKQYLLRVIPMYDIPSDISDFWANRFTDYGVADDDVHLIAKGETIIALISNNEATSFTFSLLMASLTISEKQRLNLKKYAHFSFDDVLVWEDLTTNAEVYTSIFDNVFLKDLKKYHDDYGVCFTLNVFCNNGANLISNSTSNFATEFAENSDWLKFAFHAYNSTSNYGVDDAGIADDYNEFTAGILALTGTQDSIDKVARLHGYVGTLNNILTIRDLNCGVVGLLTNDSASGSSYYLSADDNAYINAHTKIIDTTNKITFIKSQTRFENVSDADFYKMNGLTYGNYANILELFTHYGSYANQKLKMYKVANNLYFKGYQFGYMEQFLVI